MASLGTTTTVLHGNASGAPTFGAVSLTADVTGTLPTANGGTNLTSFTSGGVVYASSTSALATGSALYFSGTNLGIGTTSPAEKLEVYNSGTVYAKIHTVSGGAGIAFTRDNSTTPTWLVGHGAASANENFEIYTAGTAACVWNIGVGEIARVTSTGVSIGNTSPSSFLSGANNLVVGKGTGDNGLSIYSGTASLGRIAFADGTTGGDPYAGLIDYSHSDNSMRFSTNGGTEAIRINSSQNVGLGVTPSAWQSGRKALQVGYSSMNSYSNSQMQLGANFYFDGTNNKYLTSDYSTVYQQLSGQHQWYTAPSGTAGAIVPYTQAMTLDASGNLGVGITSATGRLAVGGANTTYDTNVFGQVLVQSTTAYNATPRAGIIFSVKYSSAGSYGVGSSIQGYKENSTDGDFSQGILFTTQQNGLAPAERARIDSSGNLLVGTTVSGVAGCVLTSIGRVEGTTGSANTPSFQAWNQATSGDNIFQQFYTEGGGGTLRGSITYNRAGGLTAYNTTSDYRAKDISGSVTDSGALIDSTPVYMGKMKGATQERPMFIAHETPSYAHTGEKDAVDADGNPVYQQMDASALIPVMWAEIQSLRKRLADAGIA
jgi:hypothetical protein